MLLRYLPSAVGLLLLAATSVHSQGHPPDQAAAKMTLPEGFRARLVASEPEVRQPVAIDFDERGRLWVMQYLQYPNPAGLKRVKVDRYSRTVYDKIPEPPPKGPKGADRLTILKPDLDKPGKLKPVDFVSGLNLASGFAFGHGGVFILQAPYLLFYPDKDRDDVPDGDPEVLLTGFGMEDAHSVANSLTWGPDGWLYGCQGSTVTANIRGIEFQQGVWRYHPITRKFELFSEGGGNMWGLDFDRHGNLFCSTNVGGHVMLHSVQGAYYWKSFGKHGALHNPYAYGYFDHVPHENFKGGHVTVGGIVYRGDAYPAKFRDKYIAADLLGHAVYWHDVLPNGSTFKTRHGGELLIANDTWFAPSDVCLGPDGCVYVADWHDPRTAHPDPDADWDRRNGRIYRIEYGNYQPPKPFDLAKLKSEELVKLLSHPNDWYAHTAQRILAERRDPEVIFPLRTLVMESKDEKLQLQALWALYVSGGFNEGFAEKVLKDSNPHVRWWAVRWLGDEERVSSEIDEKLDELAKSERDMRVLCQLACSAKRMDTGLPLVESILYNRTAPRDPQLPLLIWWAVEKYSLKQVLLATEVSVGELSRKTSMVREEIHPRLARRFAASQDKSAWNCLVDLITTARTDPERQFLLGAIDQGMKERQHTVDWRPPHQTLRYLVDSWKKSPDDPYLLRVLFRLGDPEAKRHAMNLIFSSKAAVSVRLSLLPLIGEAEDRQSLNNVLTLIGDIEPESIQLAAISVVRRFDAPEPATRLLDFYLKSTLKVKASTRAALLSRKTWAALTLQRIDEGKFPAKDFTIDELRAVAGHNDPKLDALVRKHWGDVKPPTPEAKLAEVRRLNNDLRAGSGDPVKGKMLFAKHCATCHKLFGEGEPALGPDLTFANRTDRDYLLVSIVDPSAVIRREYLSYTAETLDGRKVIGLIVEQSPERITIADAKNQRTTLAKNQIEALKESPTSLMPENMLKELKPQELRDLFGYLQLKPPK